MKNRYKILGIGFCSTGIVFTPVSYFVLESVSLTVVGISAIMIGTTCIALSYTYPPLSSEMYQLLLKTGMENTAALIEGLGLSSKAIYMPSIMRDGDQQALIPLEKNENFSSIKEILPDRLIVRYGQNPDDMAISVTTPGSISLDWYETIPGPSAGEIEFTINHVLSEVVKIADSASVILADDRIYIAVSNPKPVFEDTWYYQCMGSPIASIIAAVSSEALGKPVRIFEEDFEKTLSTITLEVLS